MARPKLLRTYKEEITTYIMFKYRCGREKAEKIAYSICASKYQPRTAIIEETKIDGQPIVKGVDLCQWFDQQADNIITPSGSVYCQHEKKLGTIIEMIQNFLAKRKVEKKAMLKAKAEGNTTDYLRHYYAQTLIKIFVNALPGNFGSRYSIFYDKGNYNAITSSGRCLIKYAYSMIEAVLGGNFMWLSIEDILNHILIQVHHGIDCEKVERVMKKYGLSRKTKDDLYAFFKKELFIYNHYTDYWKNVQNRDVPFQIDNRHNQGEMAKVIQMVSRLNDSQVQYFYYFENFRHLFMDKENDHIFRNYIKDIFDFKKIPQDPNTNPDDLFKVDGALVTMINVAFHKYLDPKDPKIQIYDLPKKRPDLAKTFVNIASYVDKKLHYVDDLFDLFVYTPLCRPNVMNQNLLYRNSAVVSDTDSAIFTVKDWVEWYTGSVYSINEEAYHIAMVMIYWITKAVAHALFKYSIAHGAKDKYQKTMAMKNEFLYPVMIQADTKKHYAGVITVQEGVILPEPDIDIKGGQFRGSTVPRVGIKFGEEFISKYLDIMYREGRISAHDAVKEIREFEQKIYDDIQNGDTSWYKAQSIKNKDDYPEPMSSAWYYYHAWQEIFAPKYGDIMLPTKAPIVPLNTATEQYWSWLMEQDKALCTRWMDFLKQTYTNQKGVRTNYRWPSAIVINVVKGKVPKELIPLIKVKDIIHTTVRPCHLFLRQLPINAGFEDKGQLFSEIYPIIKGKKPTK